MPNAHEVNLARGAIAWRSDSALIEDILDRSSAFARGLHSSAEVGTPSIVSNRVRSAFGNVAMRLRLAGVKPNSEAIRIMISACRSAIATYRDCTGYPDGDLIMVPYFW